MATGTFRVTSMEEDAYQSLDEGGKLTRARGDQEFSGDIEGQGHVEWLMCYREDKTADFVGLQRFVGRLGSRSGSFVMRSQGIFDGEKAAGELAVVAGSGTEELGGITGGGAFVAPHGSTPSFDLDYDFE